VRGVEQIPWIYDAICAFAEWRGLGPWRRWLVGGARGRTLDLGSGTGRNLPLYPAGVQVVGVEPSAAALPRARRRAPGTLLVRASAEALPFGDGVFDTVVCGLVLCTVDDPPRALAELRRVLRPGGQLRALEHVRSLRPWRARLQDAIQPAWTRLAGGCHPNRDTERAVHAAGFAIETEGWRADGTMRCFAAHVAGAGDAPPPVGTMTS
jgi:SAM-dependent methyltransferase